MNTPGLDPSVFDDLFHACALEAFLAESRAADGWPDPERTRRRAYRLYEAALAEATTSRTVTLAEAA